MDAAIKLVLRGDHEIGFGGGMSAGESRRAPDTSESTSIFQLQSEFFIIKK